MVLKRKIYEEATKIVPHIWNLTSPCFDVMKEEITGFSSQPFKAPEPSEQSNTVTSLLLLLCSSVPQTFFLCFSERNQQWRGNYPSVMNRIIYFIPCLHLFIVWKNEQTAIREGNGLFKKAQFKSQDCLKTHFCVWILVTQVETILNFKYGLSRRFWRLETCVNCKQLL